MIAKEFLLFLLLCFLTSPLSSQTGYNESAKINNDRECDISSLFLLDSCRSSYSNCLLANEILNLPSRSKQYVPNLYNRIVLTKNGKILPAFVIRGYALQIDQNKTQNSYLKKCRLSVDSVTSPDKLFLINRFIEEVGKAGTYNQKHSLLTLSHQYCFFTHTDSMDVKMQESHLSQSGLGGMTHNIHLGDSFVIEQFSFRKFMITCFILCLFVLVFAQQIILALTKKSEIAHIILALLSVLFFVRLLLVTNLIVVFHFVPDLNMKLCSQLWALTLLTVPLTLKLIKVSFSNEVNYRIEKGIYLLYALYTFLLLISNLIFIMKWYHLFVYLSGICVGYMCFILIKVVISQRSYAILHSISLIIMVLFIFSNIICAVSLHGIDYLSPVGIMIYILVQSGASSYELRNNDKQKINHSLGGGLTNQTLNDAVEQRTKELQATNMELSEINRQKDFLISTISHDLRNSYNVLLTFSRLLSKDDTLSEKHHNTMQMLYRASENGYNMLENVLEWTKLYIGYKHDLKPVTKLSEIINQNLDFHADSIEKKNLLVESDIDKTLFFYCFEGHLNAILRNLISNAIKFSHRGGVIKIRSRQQKEWVQIIIQDNGVGMSPEIYESLFNHTNNKKSMGTEGEKGSGIGLLIVKHLIDTNHGQISCYSKINKGTIFILQFRLLLKGIK